MNIKKLYITAATLGLILTVLLGIRLSVLNPPEHAEIKKESRIQYARLGSKQHHDIKIHLEQDQAKTDPVNKKRNGPTDKPTAPFEQTIKPEPLEKTSNDNNSFLDEDDIPFESIRTLLAMGIEDDFPELNLSEDELDELTEAILNIRESMQNQHVLERTSENVESLDQLKNNLEKATNDFEWITGMTLTQFLLRAHTEGGLDNDRSDDEEMVF